MLGVLALVLKRGPVTSVLSARGRCGKAVVKSETNNTWGVGGPKF